MPDHTTPDGSEFTRCVVIGLVWGAFGATALMCGALFLDAVSRVQATNGVFYIIIVFGTFVVASLLSLLHFPIAALLAWPLYYGGVRSRLAYALAGAIAAPLPFIAYELLRGSAGMPQKIEVQFFWAAWFAASGAFGGFMAARALRANTK